MISCDPGIENHIIITNHRNKLRESKYYVKIVNYIEIIAIKLIHDCAIKFEDFNYLYNQHHNIKITVTRNHLINQLNLVNLEEMIYQDRNESKEF